MDNDEVSRPEPLLERLRREKAEAQARMEELTRQSAELTRRQRALEKESAEAEAALNAGDLDALDRVGQLRTELIAVTEQRRVASEAWEKLRRDTLFRLTEEIRNAEISRNMTRIRIVRQRETVARLEWRVQELEHAAALARQELEQAKARLAALNAEFRAVCGEEA
jgi:chromosome segregation ATPase